MDHLYNAFTSSSSKNSLVEDQIIPSPEGIPSTHVVSSGRGTSHEPPVGGSVIGSLDLLNTMDLNLEIASCPTKRPTFFHNS